MTIEMFFFCKYECTFSHRFIISNFWFWYTWLRGFFIRGILLSKLQQLCHDYLVCRKKNFKVIYFYMVQSYKQVSVYQATKYSLAKKSHSACYNDFKHIFSLRGNKTSRTKRRTWKKTNAKLDGRQKERFD